MAYKIQCDVNQAGDPIKHVWSVCVGAGRANEGLRADWQQHLDLVVTECGFQYLRFHGLFHDDMFAYTEDKQGNPVYNWQYIDALFDNMLDTGIRPFVELGFMPKALASTDKTIFWWKGFVSPPKDWNKWANFIKAFVQHCIDRYGRSEVMEWYFEVWNEPNLIGGFWDGTKEQYFSLYKASAEAVKSVDARLRVGGPASSGFGPADRLSKEEEAKIRDDGKLIEYFNSRHWEPEWVEDFIAYCASETLPVDFISVHPYPTAWALDDHGAYQGYMRKKEAIVEDLIRIKEIVSKSAYPNAEIHCTEWSTSPSPRDHTHDFPQAAAYVLYANLQAAHNVDSLSYWTFTDVFEEQGAGSRIWHGGFGLINTQGLVKPTFHAYRFLNRLGTTVLVNQNGYALTKDNDGRLTGVLYNYPHEFAQSPTFSFTESECYAVLQTGSAEQFELNITGLKPHAVVALEMVDEDHGWARGEWEKMGSPEPPNPRQLEYLIRSSEPKISYLKADAEGCLRETVALNRWGIALIEEL